MIKDYDQILYDLLKPLATKAKVYLNSLNEDENGQPKDYIIYRTNISNTPSLFGDGKILKRKCNCDILVVEKGNGNGTKSGYLIKEVEQLLINNNIKYTKMNLYDNNVDCIQSVFDFFL